MKEELIKLWKEFKNTKREACDECKKSNNDSNLMCVCNNRQCINCSYIRTDIGVFLDFLEKQNEHE